MARFKMKRDLSIKMKKYFLEHQLSLFLIFFISILLYFLSQLPYLNIFLSPWVLAIIIWILAVIILKLCVSASFIVALVLLCSVPFILIFKSNSLAEEVGNAVYFLLLIGFSQTFFAYLKTLKFKNA